MVCIQDQPPAEENASEEAVEPSQSFELFALLVRHGLMSLPAPLPPIYYYLYVPKFLQ